jgi:hypothetical protein
VGEFSKDRREPVPWIGIEAEFVVTAPQVLDERVPSSDAGAVALRGVGAAEIVNRS